MAKTVRVRLVHDGVEPGKPIGEALTFGLQDKTATVHPGVAAGDGRLRFDILLDVTEGGERPVFGGPFAQGSPRDRFLYLSWKRQSGHAAPWGWRIKVPLKDIDWTEIREAEARSGCVVADVRGRRPHATAPVAWRIEPMD